MSVSLAEVTLAARARQAPLAAESAGHLVLAVADQVALAARVVRPEDVQLTEDGSVRLCAGEPTDEAGAERQLRALLGELLQAASSLTPALVRSASRPPTASLASLVGELEAALIPVNRAAARRALARVSRETTRALERGLLPPPAAEVPKAPPTPPAQTIAAPAPAPVIEPAPVAEIEVTLERTPEPEPLAETRPEPLVRRASVVPPEPLARTPRLGTLMAPSVRLEPQEPGDLTDPMPSVAEAEPEFEAVEVELEPEDLVVLTAPDPEPAAPELIESSESSEPVLSESEVRAPRVYEPRRSELGSLLKTFASADGPSEPDLRRELKKIAGLELTPPPVQASEQPASPDPRN